MEFLDDINNDYKNIKCLPLCHTTDYFNGKRNDSSHFHEIIAQGVFKLFECSHHKKSLSYFFYGKPVFQPRNENDELKTYPVTIAIETHDWLNLDIFNYIYRVALFDTGAYCKNYFDNYVDNCGLECDAFMFPPDLEFIYKIVYYFFRNNNGYYNSISSIADELFISNEDENSKKVIKYYKDLISAHIQQAYDTRHTTLEILFENELDLKNKIVKNIIVILPRILYHDQETKKLLGKLNIIDMLYYDPPNGEVCQNVKEIYEAFRNFLQTNDLIEEKV